MRVCFGEWLIDTSARHLSRAGERVHLSTKAFDLLALLVRHRPDVVSKKEINQELWRGTHVVERNIANLVSEVREALGDDAKSPRYLLTAHGIGYSFSEPSARAAGPDRRFPLVVCQGRQFPLRQGENVVGGGTIADVSVDDAAVSRRHALIVVRGSTAQVEDLGSRHGTYVEAGGHTRRISGPTPLPSPARLILGATILSFEFAEDPATGDILETAKAACNVAGLGWRRAAPREGNLPDDV
jgi:DNA-binding winged helix-turn-helix (wHTH) protein